MVKFLFLDNSISIKIIVVIILYKLNQITELIALKKMQQAQNLRINLKLRKFHNVFTSKFFYSLLKYQIKQFYNSAISLINIERSNLKILLQSISYRFVLNSFNSVNS